jgi:DNA-nicking Smr family endonuclease
MIACDENQREKSRRLDEEERTLWDQITRSVRPLARRRSSSPEAPAVATRPTAAQGRAVAPKPVQRTAPLPKPQPAIERLDRRQKQRLAQGTETIDGRLDLHSRTQAEAYAALLSFLRRARADGARFVLVITGKGSGSCNSQIERGVLNRQVPLWLALAEFRAHVVSFERAHARHGGEGALYVRLRRTRRAN